MEMECPHLKVHRKAPIKGFIGPGNGGFPCGIHALRVLATDAGLHSLLLLGTVHGNVSHSQKWGSTGKRSRDSMPHCRRVENIVDTVCFCTKIRHFYFLLWLENHLSVDLIFLSIKIDEYCEQRVQSRCNRFHQKFWECHASTIVTLFGSLCI